MAVKSLYGSLLSLDEVKERLSSTEKREGLTVPNVYLRIIQEGPVGNVPVYGGRVIAPEGVYAFGLITAGSSAILLPSYSRDWRLDESGVAHAGPYRLYFHKLIEEEGGAQDNGS